MKKVLLSLLAVAALVLSCQNYDDEFDALNAKVSSLESQISSLQGLQASLTALQSNVTALQAAVSAIPDPSSSIAALATSIAEILEELAALETAVAGASTSTELETLKQDLEDQIAALEALVEQNSDELDDLGVDVTSILGTVNTYTGPLNIRNSAELAFALNLGGKVASITGAVTVNTANLTAAEVASANTVTSKIQTVVGAVTITTTAAKGAIDLSALKVVDGAYSVTGVDAHDDALETVTGAVTLNYDGGYEQPNLKSALSVTLTNFTTAVGPPAVVGTVKVNFRNLVTTNLNTGVANTLTLPSATSVIVNAGATTVTANAATDVQVWAANNTTGLTVSATKAGSVVTIAGRVDNGAATPVGAALSVTGSATSTVNAEAVVTVGVVTITAGTVNMNAMTGATSLALTSTSPVSFPKLATSGAITANTATSVVAPLAVVAAGAASSFTLATSIELASIANGDLTAPAVKTLKLNAQAVPFAAAAFTTLTSVDVTGKAASTGAFTATSANAVLASATFGGELDAVSITGVGSAADKLTSFTTSGKIDSVTLNDSDVITSITLGHTHIPGGSGSTLIITNNAKLASLTSSSDFLETLTVTGNALLATMDFSSYKSVISTGAVAVTVTALTGTFTAAKAATATTAYSEAIISQSSLLTLKPFISAYKAALTAAAPTSTATIALDVQVTNVGTTAAPQTLAAAMHANAGVSTVIGTVVAAGAWNSNAASGAATGIDSVQEFLLIQ